MTTVYQSSPYHDDYSENKQFYRILFRPGRPVQARELTQLQTLIQGQIERFGKNIFKDGSIVLPGQFLYDRRYSYVKLQEIFNSVNADSVIASLLNVKITGRTSGVVGLVVNYKVATSTEPPTLFVKYLNSGSNGTKTVFDDNEIIDNPGATISIRAQSSSATGYGSSFSITEGAVFVRGVFAFFDQQSLVVSKYSDTANSLIGFTVSETAVNGDDDQSLLDPAVGTFNYFAPGADRYKIGLTLDTRPFTPEENDDPNFVEIARVEDGELISSGQNSSYNILEDTLARRTFDESGDYVVRPYSLKLREHLRTTDANTTVTISDGLYTSSQGGNSDLFVAVVDNGKAYVKGYEIDSIRSRNIPVRKARDYVSVNNSPIATSIGNYVFVTGLYGVPDLATLAQVDLYNTYTAANGTASGTKVGTARVRHLEFYSGTIGTSSAVYILYLFDIQMITGYTFERDVKQVYYNNTSTPDFTANVSPTLVQLTGSVTQTTSSNALTGSGTLFTSELVVNDYITINGSTYRVANVINNNSATLNRNGVSNVTNILFFKQSATINEANLNSYIFEFPHTTIKTVDPTNLETIYSTRRVYTRTLSGGNVSITAGTDETFSGVSTDNYAIIVNTGGNAGSYLVPTGNISRSGSPTGKIVTLSLSGYGYTTEEVVLITTVQKTQSAADRKIKTLVSGYSQDFTSEADVTAATILLDKADIYNLSNVLMSANPLGGSFSIANAVDITERFNFDNGQRLTFYDVGRLSLKPGAAKPTGPLRVYFDYFTHSAGDYFSSTSYGDIGYDEIPEFTTGNKTYKLRDVLDFRSKIGDSGNVFSGAGSSVSEMLDFENDLITDYEYYLPRTDKLVLTSTGKIKAIEGISSLDPKEPATPDNSMALYVFKQSPYVFDLSKDVEIIPIDNKRYTMRDIGRLENRVKNLEYYTSLSLLEKDTQIFQVKDQFGFDRFKNGFVVDSFTGHGIGDVYNTDYSVAVDYNKNELRPLCETNFLSLAEISSSSAARLANNYSVVGDIIIPTFTEEAFVVNNKASKTVSINPFNYVTFNGTLKLNPPSDKWFETNRLPDVYRNVDGNYDSVISEARASGKYGTVWGSWRDLHYGNRGNELVQQRQGTVYDISETISTSTNNDVVISKHVVPKMRDVVIGFTGEGLKPNSNVYIYFNNINVSNDCSKFANIRPASNVIIFPTETYNPISVDSTGNVSGYFYYSSTKYNLNTGNYTFRISDSIINNVNDQTTFAQTTFSSSGELRNISNEIISTRNATLSSSKITDTRTIYVEGPSDEDADEPYTAPTTVNPSQPNTPIAPVTPTTPVRNPEITNPPPPRQEKDMISLVYQYAFGREPDPEGYSYWNTVAKENGINDTVVSSMSVSTELIAADGSIRASNTPGVVNTPASYNGEALQVFNLIKDIIYAGAVNGEQNGKNNMLNEHLNFQSSSSNATENAVAALAVQLTTGIANPTAGSFAWSQDALQAKTNGVNESAANWKPNDPKYR